MKNKFIKIALAFAAVLGCVTLAVYAQESRGGYTAFATSGKYYPYGQSVVIGGGSTNITNVVIIPNDSPVKNPDPTILGAVPQVTFLDADVLTSDNGAASTPNVQFYVSTNATSVIAGNNATNDPRAGLLNFTNGTVYTTNTPGVTSNAFWLAGVVPGIITNQYVVIRHQGVNPSFSAYEANIVQWTNVVFTTNTFTNGANQTTSIIGSNTVVAFLNYSALQNVINSGDQIWFETTNTTLYVTTNTTAVANRLTLASPGGVITGERAKPMLIIGRGTNMQLTVNANFLP